MMTTTCSQTWIHQRTMTSTWPGFAGCSQESTTVMTAYTAPIVMKSHPRLTRKHQDRHAVKEAKHSCHLCVGAHPTFLCPRASCSVGQGARFARRSGQEMKRPPSRESQTPAQEATSTAAMDTSAPAPGANTAPTAIAASAAAAPPQLTSSTAAAGSSSMEMPNGPPILMNRRGPSPLLSSVGYCAPLGQEAFGDGAFECGAWTPSPMQTIHEEHLPNPSKLWNSNLRSEVLEQAGPLGSFVRHTLPARPAQTSLVMFELVNGLSVRFETCTPC